MSRRRLSLATINLENEANQNVGSPDSTTPVQRFVDNEETDYSEDRSSSTERIFHVLIDVGPQGPTLHSTFPKSPGICSKVKAWLQTCTDTSICFNGKNQVSKWFTRRINHLQGMLKRTCDKSYLETYFLYANLCGVSPFRFGKEHQQVVWLKKVPYYVVNLLAMFDTAQISRSFLLDMGDAYEDRSAEIRLYLSNMKKAATILLRIGLFVSLKYQSEKYLKLLQTINGSIYTKHLYTVRKAIVSMMIIGSSLCVVLVKVHSRLQYGWEEYIITNANAALSLFCLTTSCKQINLDPSSSITIALSLLGWSMKLAGTLFGQVARDGIFFSVITLSKCANAFKFKHRITDSQPTNSIAIGTDILTEYELIKNISKRISSAFNCVFRFFLLANIFMFAVFMDEWFNPNLGKLFKGVKLVDIIIVCITFYYANQAAKVGDRFREWIKMEKNRNLLGLSQVDVIVENSSTSSIGYGRGALFIYDSTLIGFASVVAAYFLGIVETRPQYNLREEVEIHCPCGNTSSYV